MVSKLKFKKTRQNSLLTRLSLRHLNKNRVGMVNQGSKLSDPRPLLFSSIKFLLSQ